MPENTNPEGLTTLQIAALRKCDDVAFFHNDTGGNGFRSYIRAIKRAPQPTEANPFPEERIMEIPAATRWTDYARTAGQSYPVPEFTGFHMTGNYDETPIRTVAELLKPGDKLTLHWKRDAGRTQALDENAPAFHVDRLLIYVERASGKRLTFLLASTLCEDNTARMIRRV